MQDEEIVLLYWQRDEQALRETQQKYRRYLSKIAYNILSDHEDSEECVNDTCLKAWNSIPPHKPQNLATYLGKIARQTAVDRFRNKNRTKRLASEYALSLSELEDCVPDRNTTEKTVNIHLLAEAINAFLRRCAPEERNLFVGRYFFMDSLKEVAAYYGMSEAKAKSSLYRMRQRLKAYLEQEGFDQ